MLLERIEKNLKNIQENINKDNFIFDFLRAYEQPAASIKRIKEGDYNLSKKPNEVIWKKKLYFYSVNVNEDIHEVIDNISKSESVEKNKIRFIIVTDFKEFLSIDKKNNATLDINFSELSKNNSFFLPLIGIEKFDLTEEIEADRKAAINIGKLYEQIIIDNKIFKNKLTAEDLNLFFSRLLFLYYADDSNVFEKNIFLKTIKEVTSEDGADLDKFFTQLFEILDSKNKKNCVSYLIKFPYVNGYLFKTKINLPKFTNKTREIIIKNASLEWKNINPDILGSMLQAVISTEERDDDGMHYTSVSNILKVIAPLFLDKLQEDIKIASEDEKRLKKILFFIYNLKVFDPACGSGNFLIITYKQLCLLEIKIFEYLREINPDYLRMATSGISLNQFYGIEKSHFASETTKLSLWLAEHQMNLKFCELFGEIKPSLPIENLSHIKCANAINVDWYEFCKFEKQTSFIYLIGNPPFKGYRERNIDQQNDIKTIFGSSSKADYVVLWFLKGAEYIEKNINISSLAFVSTASINQGEQVEIIWKRILEKNLQILFAHKSFIWKNNAVNNAGVNVSIIGLGKKNQNKKNLYSNEFQKQVAEINPYLCEGITSFVSKRKKSISDLSLMTYGDMANDGGALILSENEYNNIIEQYPISKKFLKRFISGADFLDGHKRWCIWANENQYKELNKISFFEKRFLEVKKNRLSSKKQTTQRFSNQPFRFVEIRKQFKNAIMVPTPTSENRKYLPVAYYDSECIITAPNLVIYDAPLYLFSILSSRMHFLWLDRVGGKLAASLRYSSEIVYNNFPIIIENIQIKNQLENLALKLIDARENFSDKTISQLYDAELMPKSIQDCHIKIDDIVESCYKKNDIISDEERLELLFNCYNKITKIDKLL
jgi:hypothetical protein